MVNFKFAKFHCYQQIQSFLITPYFKNKLKNFQYNRGENIFGDLYPQTLKTFTLLTSAKKLFPL
jgi:hypothetical protein